MRAMASSSERMGGRLGGCVILWMLLANVLRLTCKARRVMSVLSYRTGRALAAPKAG
jgi:hypothetical protein